MSIKNLEILEFSPGMAVFPIQRRGDDVPLICELKAMGVVQVQGV